MNRKTTYIVETIYLSMLAGLAIALGGTVFLLADNKALGAAAFTVGLFTVITRGLYLYTGRVCYIPKNNVQYSLQLILVWLGNLIGAWLLATGEKLTRIAPAMQEKAATICATKSADSYGSLLVLGILCGAMIFLAVDGMKGTGSDIGKHLALFFGVFIFVYCGFEHCVADMYYYFIAGLFDVDALLRILIVTVGNSIGGAGLVCLRVLMAKMKDKK